MDEAYEVELDNVTRRFGDLTAVDAVTLGIRRGEFLTLLGPSGCGKTTLLRMIAGFATPDSGRVRLGTNLQVAYFDQMRTALDPDATLEDFISPGSEWIEIGRQRKHVKSYLGDFLFSPARSGSPVRSLSGGERNRLLLARLFARPANVLVLDEPTNDLDIDTLELLEELLQDYEGTVFLVSHDRAFLDNVVTSTIAFEGDGAWREYEGGVEDWLTQSRRARQFAEAARAPASTPDRQKAAEPVASQTAAAPKRKLGFKEQRELEALPALIDALEKEQQAIQGELAEGSIYRDDPQRASTLAARIDGIEARIASLQQKLADPSLYQRDADEARSVAMQLKEAEEELAGVYARWEALEARR